MRFYQSLLVLLLVTLAGCASLGGSSDVEDEQFIFPYAPGVFYLKSFGAETDFDTSVSFRDWVIGTDPDASSRIKNPYGVASTRGKVYFNDGRQLAGYWVFDMEKQELNLIRNRDLEGSTGIAVGEEGLIYLVGPRLRMAKARGILGTDKEEGGLMVFDAQNRLLRSATLPGRPIDVAYHNGTLYITDALNHRILVVDASTLEIRRSFGERGNGDTQFAFPKGIAVDSEGRIIVGDTFNGRIKVFDGQGRFLSQYGHRGKILGTFINMSSVAVDREGRVYVVDAGSVSKLAGDHVQIFDSSNFYPSGEAVPSLETKLEDRRNALYGYFQKPYAIQDSATGAERSLFIPTGIAVDYENVGYYQNLAPPGIRFRYLIWLTSKLSANAKNISLYAFGTEE